MVYSLVLYHAWLFFPGKEGIVSGVIIAGFGIGGFIFIPMSSNLINPDNIKSSTTGKPYPVDIADNLPSAL